jgi:hypothetical protein
MAFHPTNKAPSKYAKEKTEAEGESASAQDLGFEISFSFLSTKGVRSGSKKNAA